MKTYQRDYARLDLTAQQAYWKAANSGKKEDFEAAAAATLAVRKFHSDPQAYARLVELAGHADEFNRVESRVLHVARRTFQENQLPPEMLEKMVNLSTRDRADVQHVSRRGRRQDAHNNELLEIAPRGKRLGAPPGDLGGLEAGRRGRGARS